MPITFIEKPIKKSELISMINRKFGSLVKAVVDVKRGTMSVGGELHSDEEAFLLEQGSSQEDLWGINIYPEKSATESIEFDSMINLRPSHGNYSRGVDDPILREKIIAVVQELIRDS